LRKALQPEPTQRYEAFSELLVDMSKPNKRMLMAIENQPLLERDPLLFYKMVCITQLVVIVGLLFLV
jgi:hypothetical protein